MKVTNELISFAISVWELPSKLFEHINSALNAISSNKNTRREAESVAGIRSNLKSKNIGIEPMKPRDRTPLCHHTLGIFQSEFCKPEPPTLKEVMFGMFGR